MNNTTTFPSQTAEPGLVFVVLACLLLSFWLLFLGFYFSRFAGLILTRIFSKLFIPKDAYLRIGKFLLSPYRSHAIAYPEPVILCSVSDRLTDIINNYSPKAR